MENRNIQLPNPEAQPNPELDAAAEVQSYNRRESLAESLIKSAETPQELFMGVRKLMKKLEDGSTPNGLQERYKPQQLYGDITDRIDEMSYSVDDLKDMGWLVQYSEGEGTGKLSSSKYEATAMRVELVEKSGKYGYERKLYFGTNETREKLKTACEAAKLEFEVRNIIGEHLGVRLSIDLRDSLENLVAIMHSGRVPKFKVEHLNSIFNLPGVKELETSPDNHQLGDQVEEAMFLNLVMLNSGNKQRMLDFLDRPGAKFLIAKLAKEKGQTYDEWKLKNVGNVEKWIEDKDRHLVDGDKDKNTGYEYEATWRQEARDGRRGTLTQYSNIAAWGGGPGEFSASKEKEFIEEIMGGLVGSAEASWIAAAMMRATGTYASEGYVALPNGKSLLPLGEGRFISGDDTGKYWAYMFNYKEGSKGRASGLKGMLGKIPDMAMNLFDWSQVVVGKEPALDSKGQLIKNLDGTTRITDKKRSVWDAWLGTAGGKQKIDLLTGKKTDQLTTEEGYNRLGSVDFSSLEREFHGTFSIMQWLMGNERGPVGVFIDAMNVEDFKAEDFSLNALKKKWKYVDIVMNPVVLTKGSQQLYSNPDKAPKQIKKNFLRNLMKARIGSASFAQNILNAKERLFDPNLGTAEVPTPLLIKEFVNETLKGNFDGEEGIRAHYIDENKVLRTRGTRGTSGKALDVDAVIAEKFIQQGEDEEIVSYSGRVTGRPS
jgi:hypothetical protein